MPLADREFAYASKLQSGGERSSSEAPAYSGSGFVRSATPLYEPLPRRRFIALYLAIAAGRRVASLFPRLPSQPRSLPPWNPGVSLIVPECNTPSLLRCALKSATASLEQLGEEFELIVVVNGASPHTYAPHRREFPQVRWLFSKKHLGFGGAVGLGIRRARFDWVYLLNSDMTLAADALREVARCRAQHVFAIASQVFFADLQRRREETGWTGFRIDESGMASLFDVTPQDDFSIRGHLYAGGGNSLFRTALLREFLDPLHPYNPVYWEDAEWGLRAWRSGFEVLFCPASLVTHLHRATVSRLFTPAEVDRIWKRNQLLFSLRNGFLHRSARSVIRDLRHGFEAATQREVTTLRQAISMFRAICSLARAPKRNLDLGQVSRKYYER